MFRLLAYLIRGAEVQHESRPARLTIFKGAA